MENDVIVVAWPSRRCPRMIDSRPGPRVPRAARPTRRHARPPTPARSCSTCPRNSRDGVRLRGRAVLTLRVWIDGEPHLRCYSMSSSPAVDDELQVTVKRVPGGIVSNWMHRLRWPPATRSRSPSRPASSACTERRRRRRRLRRRERHHAGHLAAEVRRWRPRRGASGSYANRDRDVHDLPRPSSTPWSTQHPDRLDVRHHLDVEDGFVDPDARAARSRRRSRATPTCTSAGPDPFMDIVEDTLLDAGRRRVRIHIERFTPAGDSRSPRSSPVGSGRMPVDAGASQVTIELDGRTDTTEHRPGTTILQVARQLGMSPPFSCESGSCATCMARLVEGSVEMHVNNALTDEEVDDGLGADLPGRAHLAGRCTSSTGSSEELTRWTRMRTTRRCSRRHRDRAAARPLRRGHDQGRHRRRDGGLHARRHLQRLRRHLPPRRLPDAWWPPPRRACSWSARPRSSSTATTGTGEQPLCFVDQTNHAMRIGWYTDTYRRTADGWRLQHPVDDVPAQERRAGQRPRPRPDPARADATASDGRTGDDGPRRVPGLARPRGSTSTPTSSRRDHGATTTLDEQMAQLSKVKRLAYDAGWMRWGWPERVGGLGGSTLFRAYLGEALAARDLVEPGIYSMTEVLAPTMIDYATPGAGGDDGAAPAPRRRDVVPGVLRARHRQQPRFAGLPGHPHRRRLAGQRPEGLDEPGPVRPALRAAHPHRDRRVRPPRHHRPVRRHGHARDHRPADRDDARRARSSARSSSTTWWCRSSARSATKARAGRSRWTCCPFERSTALWHRGAFLHRRLEQLLDAAPTEALEPERGRRGDSSLYAFRARSRATQHRMAAGDQLGPETSIDKVLLATAEQAVFDLAADALADDVLIGDDHDERAVALGVPLLAGGDDLRRQRRDPAQHHRPPPARPGSRPMTDHQRSWTPKSASFRA